MAAHVSLGLIQFYHKYSEIAVAWLNLRLVSTTGVLRGVHFQQKTLGNLTRQTWKFSFTTVFLFTEFFKKLEPQILGRYAKDRGIIVHNPLPTE